MGKLPAAWHSLLWQVARRDWIILLCCGCNYACLMCRVVHCLKLERQTLFLK